MHCDGAQSGRPGAARRIGQGALPQLKVLLLNASYPPNITAGAERVVQTLAEGLAAGGHKAVVVTTQPTGSSVQREINGVRIYYLPVRNIYRPFSAARPGQVRKLIWHAVDSYNPLMARAVGRIIDAEAPDVVNSHNLAGLSSASLGAGRDALFARVHTLHDQYLLCPKSVMFKNGVNCKVQCVDCHVLSRPRRTMTRHVDVVVGVSRFIIERHEQYGYFPNSEKQIILNALTAEAVHAPIPRNPSDPLRFGFLGQLRPTKGLHRLVDAFMSGCAADSELWIAGRGDDQYEADLRARTGAINSIRWLGFVRPDEFLASIDVLVVPSLWNDTAPLVLIEAFNAGVPVIASDRGGIPEFIGPDRGWVVDPDDLATFGKTLRHCIAVRSGLPAMGVAGRAYASRFNVVRFLDEYLDAFRRGREMMSARMAQARDAQGR